MSCFESNAILPIFLDHVINPPIRKKVQIKQLVRPPLFLGGGVVSYQASGLTELKTMYLAN